MSLLYHPGKWMHVLLMMPQIPSCLELQDFVNTCKELIKRNGSAWSILAFRDTWSLCHLWYHHFNCQKMYFITKAETRKNSCKTCAMSIILHQKSDLWPSCKKSFNFSKKTTTKKTRPENIEIKEFPLTIHTCMNCSCKA